LATVSLTKGVRRRGGGAPLRDDRSEDESLVDIFVSGLLTPEIQLAFVDIHSTGFSGR
jgi:hypothetical protein